MNRLHAIRIILSGVLFLACNFVYAEDNLYVFVFKDGLSQKNISITIDGNENRTNEYGLASFSLPAGQYELSYMHDAELFAVTEVYVLDGQQSQVFLNLESGTPGVELDLPLSAYHQDFERSDIKQQSGPKGTLKVKLLDSLSKNPVVDAKIYVKGYSIESFTSKDGIASLELAEGKYDISVVHPKFVMRVVNDLKIKQNTINDQTVELVKADIVMDDYVVNAPAVEGSLASTFAALKDSSVIGDALSSEEFTKSGDSSAADALKRVTGVTIVDGKYVYVRGLGERYSVVMLNNLFVPSPEPTKRVVPLDIFPSGVIQSMNIQKTYSADLPGTFAGGDVLIKSKDIPEEDNYIKLSLSGSFNDYTGKSVYTNVDNTNGIPADIIAKSANFQELIKGFPSLGVPGYSDSELFAMNSAIANYRNYNIQTTKLKPGSKISFDLGQSFKTSGGIKYGVVGTVYLANDANNKAASKYSTYYDIPQALLSAGEKSNYQQTELSEKLGGLLSFVLDDQAGQRIKYTYLGLSNKINSTTFSNKDGGPAGPGIDDAQRTYYEFVEKTITAHQLSGRHNIKLSIINSDIFDSLEINWDAETATATRYEPGTVEYVYEKTSNITDFTLNQDAWYLYSDLDDKLDNFRIDFKLPYKHHKHDNYTSFGVFSFKKTRTLDNRRFRVRHYLGTDVFQDIDSVFTQDNVNSDDLLLTSNYRPADAYTAKQDLTAFYINQLYSVTSKLDVFAGIRQESSSQQLIDKKSGQPYDPLETNDALASISMNYSFNNEHKIRAGFTNTLSRPDFREFSPNRYKDPITEDIVFGYPNLNYTTINNYDIKYEWYLSYDEILSLGLFIKDFTNPVETIVNQDTNSQSGKKIISYRNAIGATSEGLEVSFRKKLGFMGSLFRDCFVSGNYAYINSNIKLDQISDDPMINELSTTDRPMQGQSPYVINLNIGYDNLNTGRSAILVYNEFGKRIVALGSYGAPDYYEYPYQNMDFVVKWRINDTYDEQVKKIGYSLGFKASNILDATRETRQGEVIYETYKPGRSFSLSFTMKY